MIAVIDASAGVELVLRRAAARKIGGVLVEADWVIAPNLYISETANVFWKYRQLADFPRDECERYVRQAMALPDEFFPESDLYVEAFDMACLLGHPVYDMMYLVLARRQGAMLLTLDQKLDRMAGKAGVRVLEKH